MKFKKSFLAICIIICLFGITCAYADDTNDTLTATEMEQPDDNLESPIEENIITKADGGTFTALQSKINSADEKSTITLENDYEYDDGFSTEGITITKTLTIDGKGHKIDAKQKSRIFHVSAGNMILKNITFANGNSESNVGGAISLYGNNTLINDCVFVNNSCQSMGSAISWGTYNGRISNCIFVNNSATNGPGGAIYLVLDNNTVSDCTFVNNRANSGGAVFLAGGNSVVSGCTFVNNYVNGAGGAVSLGGDNGVVSGCTFTDNRANSGGAVSLGGANGVVSGCIFVNNHADRIGGAINCGNSNNTISNCLFMNNTGGYGAIYSVYQCIADSCVFKTPSDTCYMVTFFQPSLSVFNSTYAYNSGDKLKFRLTTNGGMPITNRNINIAIYNKDGAFLGSYNCSSGDGWVVNLPIGSYVAVCNATDYNISCVNATITVIKAKTEITAPKITAVYNKNKYLVITLKEANGKGIAKAKLTVIIKGSKTYTTDKNGRVKIPLKNLAPKKYAAKITFRGNENYIKSSKKVKVTVKKATPKITAKKKSKAKKYTVTLKNNNKPVKKAKLTLKIKGKTYRATTNKKGKATFKITKKGKFKATIKYKGNNYYNKVTKKIKITLK